MSNFLEKNRPLLSKPHGSHFLSRCSICTRESLQIKPEEGPAQICGPIHPLASQKVWLRTKTREVVEFRYFLNFLGNF